MSEAFSTALTTSIVLATFNGERFLAAQLESICRQSCLPNEVVIFDDASTDGTIEIARNFQSAAPFAVHIFSQKSNVGYAKNFSDATKTTTGSKKKLNAFFFILKNTPKNYWLGTTYQFAMKISLK